MSGLVVGAIQIVDHGGSSLTRWTLVVTGDGFTAAEQGDFENAVNDFLSALQATAPFDDASVWFEVEVHRLDVHSTESGADNPLTCPDDAVGYAHTPPEVADTCFDAAYCSSNTRRLLTVDEAAVIAEASIHVPGWDAIVVIVNHQEYGGSGSQSNGIAVYSLAPGAVEIAIHELGHVLGLADEYDDLGGTYTQGEPSEPNVTASMTADKWSAQVTANALPTLANATCTPRAANAVDPEPGAIGLYEGGKRYACGIYSPAFSCKMRVLNQPFCAVCEEHLRERFDGGFYVQPASCFVASAVYGDVSHPDVEMLRRWRNRHLRVGAPGRGPMQLLVLVYAVVGPILARIVAIQPPLAGLLRRLVFQPWASRLRRRP
jgi:hypothetical protein